MLHHQVSPTRRAFQVISAIFWCLFAAGPLFGFAALKPFLIKEGVYEDVCDISSISILTATAPKCSEQDLKLNFIFTICAVLTNVCALPIGYLLDNYGPKLCGLIGASSILVGTLIVAFLRSITSFDPYITGFGLVALGGPFTFISSFHLSNAFPLSSGLILAFLTGAFDASSSVFLIYALLNRFLSTDLYYFSIASFFRVYLVVPLFIFAVQLFLMPHESYQVGGPEVPAVADAEAILLEVSESLALLPKARRRSSLLAMARAPELRAEQEEEIVASGGIFGILHGKLLSEQFKSRWFLLIAIFSTIQMLRLNYFISTVNSQYTYLLGSHEAAAKLNRIFDVALPIGGLISIPFVGYLLDHFLTVFVVATLSGLSVFLGVLNFVPHVFYIGVINVLLFVAYRPFFYTTISDVTGKVFGFETFGIVYGTIMLVSGVINFGQSYLDKLTHTVFNMNPGPINYILVGTTFIVASATVLYVKKEADHFGKENVKRVVESREDALE